MKTLLDLKTMLKMKTMISKGKIFVQFILELQMKYRLRRQLIASMHLVHSLVQEKLS